MSTEGFAPYSYFSLALTSRRAAVRAAAALASALDSDVPPDATNTAAIRRGFEAAAAGEASDPLPYLGVALRRVLDATPATELPAPLGGLPFFHRPALSNALWTRLSALAEGIAGATLRGSALDFHIPCGDGSAIDMRWHFNGAGKRVDWLPSPIVEYGERWLDTATGAVFTIPEAMLPPRARPLRVTPGGRRAAGPGGLK